MRFVDWNISYMGDHEKKFEFLFSHLQGTYCVLLQEVKPYVYEYVKQTYGNTNQILYSLDFRSPGKFDSNARKLGVMIILSPDITLEECGVIERNLFPDRTLYATLNIGEKTLKVLALHSITGCDYYKTKSAQFNCFAEFIDTYKPDIIGIDANEPAQDAVDVDNMVFFDNGSGAETFFKNSKIARTC